MLVYENIKTFIDSKPITDVCFTVDSYGFFEYGHFVDIRGVFIDPMGKIAAEINERLLVEMENNTHCLGIQIIDGKII